MQPHQQRVVDELTELEIKSSKLAPFIGTPIYNGLSIEEQDRLKKQLTIMAQYADILRERIAAFY